MMKKIYYFLFYQIFLLNFVKICGQKFSFVSISISSNVYSFIQLYDFKIALGTSDSLIRIWDINSQSNEFNLSGHTSIILSLCQLKDGTIASGSVDSTIKIWNLYSRTTILNLKNLGYAHSLIQLQDGRLAASSDKSINIWNLSSQTIEFSLYGHYDSVLSIIQLQDGRIASASEDYSIKIWNLSYKSNDFSLLGHSGGVRSIIQLKDGRIASGSVDGMIKIWNLTSRICEKTLTENTYAVLSIIQLEDGKLASVGADRTIRIWNLETQKFQDLYDEKSISTFRLIIKLKDGRIASFSTDYNIRIWLICENVSFSENCKTLSTNSCACIECNANFELSNNLCILLCDQSCLTCKDSSQNCIECKTSSNYFPKVDESNTCILNKNSPKGYYFNSTTNKHEKCDISCSICLDSTKSCISCNISNLYYPKTDENNLCFLKTISPNGYYFDSGVNKHEKCDISCNNCAENDKKCTTCNQDSNYYHLVDDRNTCFLKINSPTGYYFDLLTNIHEKCDISCTDCIDYYKKCTTCYTLNFYYPKSDENFVCILKSLSPYGYYFDSELKKHEKCDISCMSCSEKSKNCIGCNDVRGYYNTKNNKTSCYNNAPDGFVFDSIEKIYIPCDLSCKTCTISPTNCLVCNTTSLYFPKVDDVSACFLNTNSPSGYYFDVATDKHQLCDISCIKCVDTPKKCTDCNTFSLYYPKIDDINSCIYKMNNVNGYFFDSDNKIFNRCNPSCENCHIKSTLCLTCTDGHLFLNKEKNYCVISCPEKTWKNLIEKVCSPCNASCKKCVDNTNICLECEIDYFPLEGNKNFCYKTCPIGYVRDFNNQICKKCPLNCENCNLDETCNYCSFNFFLNKSSRKCDSKCISGFYSNKNSRICTECVSPCKECSDFENCLSCQNEFYLITKNQLERECVNTCPDGHYPNATNNMCELCDNKCKSCDNLNKCSSCQNDYFFHKDKNECLIACPNKYYDSDKKYKNFENSQSLKTCEKCSEGCSTCKEIPDFCTSCENGYFMITSKNKCVSKCPDGYYSDLNNKLCLLCHSSCLTCNGPHENRCSSCTLNSGLSLKSGFCTKEGCPIGYLLMENNACFNLSFCFEFAYLSIPKIFNLESDPFVSKFIMKLKTNCEIFRKDLSFKWNMDSSIFEKAEISSDNTTLTISRDFLQEGEYFFKFDFYYVDILLTTFEEKSNLIINKLIPKIKNDNKPSFIYGYDIKIDASNSIDEGFMRLNFFEKYDPHLNFSWECPDTFYSLCSDFSQKRAENKILLFKYSDYKKLIKPFEILMTFDVTLKLFKDRRFAEKKITFILKNTMIFSDDINKSDLVTEVIDNKSNSSNLKDINIIDLILIEQSTLGNEDILFTSSFIDPNVDMLKYKYHWTILNFLNDDTYLNGRNESKLRVKYSEMLIGVNIIHLKITHSITKKEYEKNYEFQKGKPPYGGSCNVSPQSGISLFTNFTFVFSDWKSNVIPLIYKLKYENKDKLIVDLSNGGISSDTYVTNFLPVSNKLLLEVIDNQGISTYFPCYVNANLNKNLEEIGYFVDSELDISKKLIIIDIYKSNKNQKNVDKDVDLYFDFSNKVVDFLDDYFENMKLEKFLSDYDNIISTFMSVLSENFTDEKIKIIYKILNLIVKYIDPLLNEFVKLENLYMIIDNLQLKASLYLESLIGDENNYQFSNLNILQTILNKLNEKLFNNIIHGQNLVIKNINFDTQMNKISSINPNNICIDYSYSRKGRRRIRRLQSQKQCNEGAAFELDSNLVSEIIKNHTGYSLGFQSQLNNNKNIPIATNSTRKIFSESSLDFYISAEDSFNNKRILNLDDININFEIRLKLSNKKDNSKDIADTTCVQFDINKIPTTFCISWYDPLSYEVICQCLKQGLTVNIMDKVLSNISKLEQFPLLNIDFFNPYSFGIVGTLIILLAVLYFLAKKFDNLDTKTKYYIQSENYDKIQYYIVKFYYDKFDKEFTFLKLYCYLIKNLHPVISFLHLYDPYYSRTVRVLDFFLSIQLSFFFTLLPFYLTGNASLIEVAQNRNIENRNKKINDIEMTIKQIIQGVLYSILASFVTLIITSLLSVIFYKNVLKEEAFHKKILTEKVLKKNYGLRESYFGKLRSTYFKIKTLMIISGAFRKKIIEFELNKRNRKNLKNKVIKAIKGADSNSIMNIKINRNQLNYDLYDSLNVFPDSKRIFHYKKVNGIFANYNLKNNAFDKLKNIKKNCKENSGKIKIKNSQKFPFDIYYPSKIQEFSEITNNKLRTIKTAQFHDFKDHELEVELNPLNNKINERTLNHTNDSKVNEKTEKDLLLSQNFLMNDYQIVNNLNNHESDMYDIYHNEGKYYKTKNLAIFNENFEIYALKEVKKKSHKKIFIIRERIYIFPTNSKKFSSFFISILNRSKIENFANIIKSNLKKFFMFILSLLLWIYLMLFIQSISMQYGDNIIKICVMPLISIIIIKLVITFNVMMFLTTLLLYNFGEYFLNLNKLPLIQKIIFKAFVSPLAFHHYASIRVFLDLIKK